MKKDRRVLRTKQFIRDALIELIEEKGFDPITVTDLSEKANINRGTFYLHYEDKFDLLRKLEEEILFEFKYIVSEVDHEEMFDDIFSDKPLKFLVDLFTFISNNRRLFKAILGHTGDPQFYHSLKSFMAQSMYSQNNRLNNLLKHHHISIDYFTAYLSSAHLGVIQQWLENDLDQPPEELALLLTKMFKFGPLGVLKK